MIIFLANQNKDNLQIFYIKYKWFIPISIFICLFISYSTSYIYIKLHFYMELGFISPIKLIILFSFLGFIISSIACAIGTSFKCIGSEKEYFCTIKTNIKKEKNYDIYIENLFIFFEKFSLLKSKDIIIEILIISFGMIFNFCYVYFGILIINYLSPLHFILSNVIYIILSKLIILIRNIKEKGFYLVNDTNQFKIRLMNISSYFFSFVGLTIYLEIIELNFCKFNYNLRKHIMERGILDINEDEINDTIINDEENSLLDDNVELPINEKK